jgi:hypothetical protein
MVAPGSNFTLSNGLHERAYFAVVLAMPEAKYPTVGQEKTVLGQPKFGQHRREKIPTQQLIRKSMNETSPLLQICTKNVIRDKDPLVYPRFSCREPKSAVSIVTLITK